MKKFEQGAALQEVLNIAALAYEAAQDEQDAAKRDWYRMVDDVAMRLAAVVSAPPAEHEEE